MTGTALVVAYAALAGLQILVLNPLAAAPGLSLEQIRQDLSAAGESLRAQFVLVVLAFGVACAILVLVLAAAGRLASPTGPALAYLALLVLGAPAYVVASFPAGMSLADTYGISGGDHSPWASPLFATSLAALLLGIALAAMLRPAVDGSAA